MSYCSASGHGSLPVGVFDSFARLCAPGREWKQTMRSWRCVFLFFFNGIVMQWEGDSVRWKTICRTELDWKTLRVSGALHQSHTRARSGNSVVSDACRRPYIIATSCLKSIWKLLGCDPTGGWGLWVLGEHHVSQTQLYKLRAHAPRSRYPPSSTPACGSLEVECGSLRVRWRHDIAWLKVMYTVSWVTCRLTKSPRRTEVGEENKNSNYCVGLKNPHCDWKIWLRDTGTLIWWNITHVGFTTKRK